jgi:hypothetical protein
LMKRGPGYPASSDGGEIGATAIQGLRGE